MCHLQHKLIGFYNPDEKCLQRGTEWVFKYSSLRFVFRRVHDLHLSHKTVPDQIDNDIGRVCSTYGGREEVHTGFWWGNLRKRYHLEDPGVDGRIILRWIFSKWDVGAWNGSSWLRIGTGGGYLLTR